MMKRAKGIFVTGTDTGVGKTVITELLVRYLCGSGYNCIRQKWIETGSALQLESRSLQLERGSLIAMCLPYLFKFPGSPHLASQREKRRINPARIIKSYKTLAQKFDFVIVEGTGGALVPMNKKSLIIDIAKKLNLPVLIVSRNKLGAINHTLLTIEALRQRRLKILGIVFCNAKKENKVILQDNPKIIKVLSKEKIFGILPWERRTKKLYKKFVPIGKEIASKLKSL